MRSFSDYLPREVVSVRLLLLHEDALNENLSLAIDQSQPTARERR